MSDQKLKPWRVVSKHMEYSCPIWQVVRKEVVSSKGDIQGNFYVTETNPWVNVLALDRNENVILVEQYRHGIEEITWEIPAGVVDDTDKSALSAAQRELDEETGYTTDNWIHLGHVSANPAIMNNRCDIFLARDCRKVNNQELDDSEEVRVQIVPVEEFLGLVANNDIHHSLAVASVAKWLIYQSRQ